MPGDQPGISSLLQPEERNDQAFHRHRIRRRRSGARSIVVGSEATYAIHGGRSYRTNIVLSLDTQTEAGYAHVWMVKDAKITRFRQYITLDSRWRNRAEFTRGRA